MTSTIHDDIGSALRHPVTGRLARPHERIPAGMSRPELGLVQGVELFSDPTASTEALEVALGWLREDQRPGLGRVLVGHELVREWVDEPLDRLADGLRDRRGRRARAGVAALRRRLRADLLGSTVTVADVHGAPAPGRWWFDDRMEEVVAVDGWRPVARGLAEVDVVLLATAARELAGTSEPGLTTAVGELLSEGWTDDERRALGPGWITNTGLRPSTIVLLAWLEGITTADGPGVDRLGSGAVDHEVRELLEQLVPDGLLDSSATDDVLSCTDGPDDAVPAERARRALAAAAARADRRVASRTQTRRTVGGLGAGLALWAGGTYGIDVSAMSDTGLLSILRPTAHLGLFVLLATFCAEVASRRPSTWRLAAPVVALVAAVHGTPAVLYGLRYSWAWKHLGIIDFIDRNGTVDPSVQALDVYHNWPGFFAVNSALANLFGVETAATYARWWPLLANLAVVPLLLYVFRGLRGGGNVRTRWLGVVVFLTANWIGQDYFSPQSMVFLLYLLIIGVVLQFTGTELRETQRVGGARPRRWSVAVALVAAAVVITSHQVTPVVLLVALVALSATRQARAARIAAGVVALAAIWSTTGAWAFLSANVSSLLEGMGQPVANADQNLVDQGRLSDGQALVSTLGRVALVLVALLGLLGVARELRRRRVDGAGIALLLAPGSLLFANTFGGEIAFRTYLFALPFLSWYAALALWPAVRAADRRVGPRRAAARGVLALAAASALLGCSLFGYYGKDAYYTFSQHEVDASSFVLDDAPQGSLLVTITANYPGQWKGYERLTYVPIAEEGAATWRRIEADPVGVLGGWLSGDEYSKGYLLLTRSQEREVESQGVLPPGAVGRLRNALDASPRFRTVYASPEAQVYELATGSG
ncbi:MAG TPA: hypothetical protein VHK88_11570 [Aquihabitans sp.]|jgi:hypothetical protein|nr:hypothetical protein [Aquihabitans sp.]